MVKNLMLLGVQINKKIIKKSLNKWTKEIISTLFTQEKIYTFHSKTLEDVTELITTFQGEQKNAYYIKYLPWL